MAKRAQVDNLKDHLIAILVGAETVGVREIELVRRLRYTNLSEIKHELELLLAEDKVQVFYTQHRAKVWRATNKIFEPRILKTEKS